MKLYQVINYDGTTFNTKTKDTNALITDGNSSKLCKALETDNSYHIRIFPNKNVIAYGDIDHIIKEEIFEIQFLNKLVDIFNLGGINEISYTKSIKIDDNEFSYHWSIPSIETTCYSLKQIMTNSFNEFVQYIDTGIYPSTSPKITSIWFRMPNQTNTKKTYSHIIIQGKMKDFLIHHIKDTEYQKIEIEPEPLARVEHVQDKNIIVNYELINNLEDEFNEYSRWCKMGWIFKSIGYPFEEFVRMSRTSKKFKSVEDCLTHWDGFKTSKINEGLLHSILKHSNPLKYTELGLSYKFIEPTKEEMNFINIEQRYLISTDNEKLDDANDTLTNNINEFFSTPSIKSLNIKSPYDTGKTKLIEKIFNKFEPKKILWLSYRKTLTNDILGSFGKKYNFKDYQEKKYDSERLIIQVESLLKLKPLIFEEDEIYEIPKYDLVIIDEIESIMAQFDSVTFKGKARDTFEFMTEIIKGSTKLITLDGDMSSRSYSFINHFGESRNIVNKVLFNKRKFILNYNADEVYNQIKQDMKDNKHVVVASLSTKQCSFIFDMVKLEFPDKKISIYTGQTDDQNKLDLLDVLSSWDKLDLLIYSPTIEAGVSFDISHFDKIYGIVCGRSTSQRAFVQMLSRVRKINCDTITILNISYTFKINTLNSNNMYSYTEVKQSLLSLGVISMTEIIKDGVIKRQLSLYDTNHIHNKIEELYKHEYYFLAYLKHLLESKGHTFTNLDNMTKPKKKEINDDDNDIIDNILMSVKDIDKLEYEKLIFKQKQSQATAEDKIQIKKYVFKKCLGVDTLSNELIENYDFWTISNYISLIDTDNIRKTTDAHYKEKFKKCELITKLINDIGFKNMYDRETTIKAEELNDKLNDIVEKNKIFSDDKASRVLFNSRSISKQYNSIKGFLGCVNTLLETYSLIILSIQGTTKINGKRSYVYSLQNTKGREFIDELLQYRINNGLNMHDNNNIRNYEPTTNYDNLIKKEPINIPVFIEFLDDINEPEKIEVNNNIIIEHTKLNLLDEKYQNEIKEASERTKNKKWIIEEETVTQKTIIKIDTNKPIMTSKNCYCFEWLKCRYCITGEN
jgi:hypothetical protein